MKVLSHRGYWMNESEKNSSIAFERSFKFGFGTETDIRDYLGELVISHDIAVKESLKLSRFFEIYKSFDETLPLALNIKADGLQARLRSLLNRYDIKNYFLFDMSVPEAVRYIKQGFTVYTRHSEYEREPNLYVESDGVWMDEFNSHWITVDHINGHLLQKKKVCIVSPELHGRKYRDSWKDYKENLSSQFGEGIYLCTDKPEDAREYFNE